MIELDGSYLEGGGQMLRTALALSCIKGKAFHITKIRRGRKQPGLKNQHLYAISILGKLTNARVENAFLGSDEIEFFPGKIQAKNLNFDTGTAASLGLILQSIIPAALFAPNQITIKLKGGTDVQWAMPYDYLANVFAPQTRKYCNIGIVLRKRGYYPKGGGQIEIRINPKNINEAKAVNLVKQGKLMQIRGISHCSQSLESSKVSDRQADAALATLRKTLNCPIEIERQYCDTLSPGAGIVLYALFADEKIEELDPNNPVILGADALGERGKSAEAVGEECAKKLLNEVKSGACADSHLADNMIPLLGLFGGSFRTSEITSHTLTNIYATEQFLDVKFEIDEKKKIISCSKKE